MPHFVLSLFSIFSGKDDVFRVINLFSRFSSKDDVFGVISLFSIFSGKDDVFGVISIFSIFSGKDDVLLSNKFIFLFFQVKMMSCSVISLFFYFFR
jgi:hypothetical protein